MDVWNKRKEWEQACEFIRSVMYSGNLTILHLITEMPRGALYYVLTKKYPDPIERDALYEYLVCGWGCFQPIDIVAEEFEDRYVDRLLIEIDEEPAIQ